MTERHPDHPDAGPAASGATSRPVPPVPAYLAHRPTLAGLVVPYVTAQTADGRFLFGALDPRRLVHCLTGYRCQVCGRRLERPVVLLMRRRDLARQCVSEPGCHPVCAAYTAQACPMVAGRMEHYRSSPVRLGSEDLAHAADTAARLGQPAEVWYRLARRLPHDHRPDQRATGRRLRRHPATAGPPHHPNGRVHTRQPPEAAVMSPPEAGTGRQRLRCDRRHR